MPAIESDFQQGSPRNTVRSFIRGAPAGGEASPWTRSDPYCGYPTEKECRVTNKHCKTSLFLTKSNASRAVGTVAIRFQLRDMNGLSDGTRIDYHLLSLPLYMVGQARGLVAEIVAERGGITSRNES